MDVSPASILLVDDSPEKLIAIESVLIDLPVRIVKVSSGRDALRQLLTEDFAVILLDVRMPGMDGFETAALIRQRARSAQTPIIFITAFGDETHVARGYSLRAVDYIMTPVVPDVLRTKVGVFVDLYRTTAQVRRQAEAMRLRSEQLHRLTVASLAIHSSPSVDAILESAARSTRELLGAARAIAEVRLDDRRTRRSVSEIAGAPGDADEDRSVAAMVARSNRAYRATRAQGVQDREIPAAAVETLAVPLVTRDGRNMGLIQVSRPGDVPFTDQDQDLLLQLAQTTGLAIENTLFSEAREANRLKDEFIATVSHELRTPLNALRSWAWILRSGELSAEKTARAVDAIERNVLAQSRIVDDLLDVSRIVTGKLRLNTRRLDLKPIVESAIEALAAAAAAKGLTITPRIDVDAGPVLGDEERLQQVVWNLVSNAVKFTPESGRVEVHLERAGGDVAVRVCDTGQGICAEFLPHVFERFRQGDASSTRASGGLGLGLAIVRHLVELHGGRVQVASDGEGRGATFTVMLPIAPVVEAEAATSAAMPADRDAPGVEAPCGLEGVHVLVVEDEMDTRDALAEMIADVGGRVTAVGTASEALQAVAACRPDVVLCDIGLPGEDGYSFIRKMRAMTENGSPAVPAIALTAYAQDSDRKLALAAGFHAHLAKPVQPARLIRLLAQTASASAPATAHATALASPQPEPAPMAAAPRG